MTTIVIIIILSIAIIGVLFLIYQQSPIYKNRKQIKKTLRALQQEIKSNDDVLNKNELELEKASLIFLKAQKNQRMKSLPIEAITDAGATNIRFSILHNAGYHNLSDLSGVNARKLLQLRGIGQTSARKIVAAADEMFRRIDSLQPTLPKPVLSEPFSKELAQNSIKLVASREALSEDNDRMKEMLSSHISFVENYYSENNFMTWIFCFGDTRHNLYSRSDEKAQNIFQKSKNIEESDPFCNTRVRRPQLMRYNELSMDDTLNMFRDRFADYSALIENVISKKFTPSGEKPREIRKIPKDIVEKIENFNLDATKLKVTLRPYQQFGAKYILVQERTILGDEMGLGKTIEALAAISHLWEKEQRRLFLVISPAGITVNWEREIQNRLNLPCYRLHGQEKERLISSWIKNGGIAIISYNLLSDLDLSRSLLGQNRRIDMLIADEAHYVKNPAARRTKAIATILPLSKYLCFMSGTPMENHPREFVRLIDLVRPGEGKQYCKYQLFNDHYIKDTNQFHQIAASIYLRRNQEDVLHELPEKIEVPEWVELTLSDDEAYRQAVMERNFMAMRRSVTIGSGNASAKMRRLKELIREHRESGRKVLIFSFFLDVLKLVHEGLNAIGMITGALSSSQRMELVDKFQKSKGFQVLVSQIEAGGQGINLQSASVVIIMEPQFKPTTEAQAIARAHRMGQTNRVIVHRLLARNSVDEKLVAILTRKQDMFEKYARESFVKNASPQAINNEQIKKDIIESERQRLGIE